VSLAQDLLAVGEGALEEGDGLVQPSGGLSTALPLDGKEKVLGVDPSQKETIRRARRARAMRTTNPQAGSDRLTDLLTRRCGMGETDRDTGDSQCSRFPGQRDAPGRRRRERRAS